MRHLEASSNPGRADIHLPLLDLLPIKWNKFWRGTRMAVWRGHSLPARRLVGTWVVLQVRWHARLAHVVN